MEPGDYYIVVMPGTYRKMFVAATTMDNKMYVKYSSKENIVIVANEVVTLGNVASEASSSKPFALTGIPAGPFSLCDSQTIGLEIGDGYKGKTLLYNNKQKDVISGVEEVKNDALEIIAYNVTFNKKPGAGILDIVYDGVRYPVLFDVRPWYRDKPDDWKIVTSGASMSEVRTSDKGESYVEITAPKGRADIQRKDKPWMSPAMAPILAFRLDDINGENGYSSNIKFDWSGFASLGGEIGPGNNTAIHRYSCSDGSKVIVYELSRQKLASNMLPEDFLADGTITLKYADIKLNGTAAQSVYRFFWFRSFASIADLEAYLNECTANTGLTYTKTK